VNGPPEWYRRVQAERRALEEGGIPKTGDATGWIIMIQNNVGKAMKAFADGDDRDARKFLYRLAALGTLWAELLVDDEEPLK